jgi:hypothetical protein
MQIKVSRWEVRMGRSILHAATTAAVSSLRSVARRVWLLLGLLVLLLLTGYLAYDWTRPCVGGPVKQLVLTLVNGGSYTVRCAG